MASGNPGSAIILASPCWASHNPERSASVAVILTCLLLFLSSSAFAYYKPIPLEPATEVIVRFQQEAGAEDRTPRQWGLCCIGNPNRPTALALRPLGLQAVPLFLLATEYPLHTYLDQTPLEFNLRYVVGQKLQNEASSRRACAA